MQLQQHEVARHGAYPQAGQATREGRPSAPERLPNSDRDPQGVEVGPWILLVIAFRQLVAGEAAHVADLVRIELRRTAHACSLPACLRKTGVAPSVRHPASQSSNNGVTWLDKARAAP